MAPRPARKAGAPDPNAGLPTLTQERWTEVVEELRRIDATSSTTLVQLAQPAALDGDRLVLGFVVPTRVEMFRTCVD